MFSTSDHCVEDCTTVDGKQISTDRGEVPTVENVHRERSSNPLVLTITPSHHNYCTVLEQSLQNEHSPPSPRTSTGHRTPAISQSTYRMENGSRTPGGADQLSAPIGANLAAIAARALLSLLLTARRQAICAALKRLRTVCQTFRSTRC